MSKKTTKQLKEILMSQYEYWSQSSERIMDKINQQVEPEKPVFFIYYVEDGIPMIYSYCQKKEGGNKSSYAFQPIKRQLGPSLIHFKRYCRST